MNFKVLEQEIQRLYEETPENICGVGYGQKSVAGSLTNHESIVFHVYKKIPREELTSEDLIPEKIVIDGKEYLTDVIETPPGCFRAYADCYNPLDESDIEILRLRGQSSAGALVPLRGGQQIVSFPVMASTGTLGFFAIDNEDGKVVGVTNTHVAMDPIWYSKDVARPLGGASGELFNTTNTIEPKYSSFDEKKYPIGSAIRSLYDYYIAAEHVKRFVPLRSDGQRNIEPEGGDFVTDKKKNYVDAALLVMSRENFANTSTPLIGATSYAIHGPISTDSATPPRCPFATTEELEYFFTEAANGVVRNVYATGGRSGPKGYCPTKRLKIYLSGVTTPPVEYTGGDATFNDAFYIRGAGDGTTIPSDNTPGRPGDSGSGVLADVIEITHATVSGDIVGGQNTITNAVGSQIVLDAATTGIDLSAWVGAKVQITSNTTGITLVQNTTIQSVSGTFNPANPTAPRTVTLSNSFTGTGSLTNVLFELTKYSTDPVRKLIGLFFAGGTIQSAVTGIACRIDHVANALNIRAWTADYPFDSYHSLSKSVPIVLRSSDFASADPTIPPPEHVNSDLYQLKEENGVVKKYWHSGCTLQNYYSASGPTDIVLDTTKILHNNTIGDVVGQLSVVDPDTTKGVIDVYQYTLAPGDGSTDNSAFRITANLLRANAVFTTGATKSIRVSATDTRGRSFSKSFSLNVVGSEEITPGTPTGISGNGQVVLSWSAPVLSGSVSPMYYVVEYSDDDFVTFNTQVVSGAPPVPPPANCIVGALKNGTAYKFKVHASLSDGRMTAASPASASIIPATVPDAPTSFFAAPYSAGTIQLSWAPPSNNGGSPITDYSVEYNAGSPPNRQTWTLYNDAVSSSTGCFVSGLNATSAYLFRVRSKNAIGFSLNWAESTPAVSPPAVANAPTNLTITAVGNAQVSLSWTAPTNVSSSAIQYYVIQHKLASDTSDNWLTFAGANSATTTRTVTGLANGSTYVFRVRAQTAYAGDWSATSSSAMPEATTPGAPASILATVGDSQVSLSWTAPTDNGGATITQYKVERSTDNSSWSEFTTGGPFSASPVVITGLVNGTTYWFRVSAKNYTPSFGPPTATTSSVTPFGVPAAVSSLTAATFANKQATLTWIAPTNTNGKTLTKYVVQYRVNVLPENWLTFNNNSAPLATTAAITGLTNGTTYVARVYAENNPGSQSTAATSSTFSPPLLAPQAAPLGFSVSPGNESASLLWTTWDDASLDNGGSPVTGYIAGHKLSSGSTWTDSTLIADTSTSYAVTGLQNGQTYDFRLAAVNAQGTSAAYALSNDVPIAQGAPSPPLNVIGTPADSEVTVSWSTPANDGGSAISSYVIEFSTDGINWSPAATINTVALRTYTVTSLANGTAYRFRVTATNASGSSSPSAPSDLITPRTTPPAPTDLTATEGVASVSLTWVAPTDNGGAALSGYVVEHKVSSASTWNASNINDAATLDYVVQGLTNGVSHDFRIAAKNVAGTGTPSSSVSATPRTTPSAPTAFSGTAGDTQVDLSWAGPSDDGGSAVTGYIVRHKENAATDWTDIDINDASTLSTSVTGLTNDTVYLFKVAAKNVAGTGPDTTQISVTPAVPPTPTPGKPTITSVVVASEQATVSWSVPTYAGSSAITGYKVQYYSENNGYWEDYYDNLNETYIVNGTSVVVGFLVNGVQHKFRVLAVNASGDGEWSDESSFYTPIGAPSAPLSFSGSEGNAQINLIWSAPTYTNGAAIDKYKIEYSDDAGATWYLFSDTLSSTLLYASVTGLQNGTSHLFKIYAHNSVGWSVEAASSSYTPSDYYPTAPTGFTATAGDGQVDLSWTAPSNVGTGSTEISSYVVEISYNDRVTWSVYDFLTTTAYSVTGLINGTTYWFRVNGVNDSLYYSNFSTAVSATPTAGA